MFIAKNGDTSITREDHVRADGRPLRYWSQQIIGKPDSTPIDFVEQLGYEVDDVNGSTMGHGVVYLVLDNSRVSKEIAVFHLPEIDPSETAARVIKTKFTWPQFSTKLIKTKTEDWGWVLKSRQNVALFELTVGYDKSLGTIGCTVLSAQPTGSQLMPLTTAVSNGYKYTVPNSPANGFKHELRFMRS